MDAVVSVFEALGTKEYECLNLKIALDDARRRIAELEAKYEKKPEEAEEKFEKVKDPE